jgi:hypothetical protein
MIARSVFHAAKNRCGKLLVSQGYEPVIPVTGNFLSRYIPLHLIGMRGNYEALCVKIRHAQGAVTARYFESFCRFGCCQLRSLLTMYPGDIFLRCEVRVISPGGGTHCYEMTRDRQRHGGADMVGPAKNPANGGDLIFSLVNYPDRIAKRLNKKIERPGHRRTIPGQRGRL